MSKHKRMRPDSPRLTPHTGYFKDLQVRQIKILRRNLYNLGLDKNKGLIFR